jgi:hypothetical protein
MRGWEVVPEVTEGNGFTTEARRNSYFGFRIANRGLKLKKEFETGNQAQIRNSKFAIRNSLAQIRNSLACDVHAMECPLRGKR